MRVTDVGENVDRLASKQTLAVKGKKSGFAKPEQLRGELSRLFKLTFTHVLENRSPRIEVRTRGTAWPALGTAVQA